MANQRYQQCHNASNVSSRGKVGCSTENMACNEQIAHRPTVLQYCMSNIVRKSCQEGEGELMRGAVVHVRAPCLSNNQGQKALIGGEAQRALCAPEQLFVCHEHGISTNTTERAHEPHNTTQYDTT